MGNLISFGGIFVLLGVAWLLSERRRAVSWAVVLWGLVIQALVAVFIFLVPVGTKFFLLVNSLVVKVLESATAGTRFLFGRLALPPGATTEAGEKSLGFILAFQALPTIVFFSSLVAALYYVGVMSWLVRQFSRLFTRLMGVSGAESLCAASNIFVGVEAATTVRPHLSGMTRSELCTLLTAGMATIASSVLAFYVFILRGEFPTIAGHLVSASVLSAPAAIVMSKLLVPETGRPETLGMEVSPRYQRESSLMEAIINGANAGVRLVVGIAALLLAFLGIVDLLDSALRGLGGLLGLRETFSLGGLLGYLFYPFTLAIGVPRADVMKIAHLLGERTVVTEVKAYQDLAVLMRQGALEPRSAFLAAYALCGFAHVASLAIFVGGIAALVPERTRDLSALGFKALLAATLACLMTAAVAGTFFRDASILMGG
ncbi:MAG: nucleoside transporter C-terminal domain-containing protein [Nitrospirota bacterium]